jgi:hypothetical protein
MEETARDASTLDNCSPKRSTVNPKSNPPVCYWHAVSIGGAHVTVCLHVRVSTCPCAHVCIRESQCLSVFASRSV